MKANISIQLEGEEALELLRAIYQGGRMPVAKEPLNENNNTPINQKKMTEEPEDKRHCTMCGCVLNSSSNIKEERMIRRDYVCNKCYPTRNKRTLSFCRKCGVELTIDNKSSKRSYICKTCKVKKDHTPISAEQRTIWARERREIVGGTITQPVFYGALITEHVRGSHYKVQLPSGQIIDAKHKKQKTLDGDELGAGWSEWINRS